MKQLRIFASAPTFCAVLIGTIFLLPPIVCAEGESASFNSSSERILLRTPSDKVDGLVDRYDLNFVSAFEQGSDSVLLSQPTDGMPAEQLSVLLLSDADVISAEVAELAALPAIDGQLAGLVGEGEVVADLMRTGTFTSHCFDENAAAPWSGYADQQTAALINLHAAHQASLDCGAAATVAIIDNAVDVDHPLLGDVMLPGYDFRLELPGMPESAGGLDQSIMAILELHSEKVVLGQGSVAMLDTSIAPIVDPELASNLENETLPPFFGHGTMVAGIVHLAAPAASIMPLRVFDDQGNGHVYDVVRAIYYAVDNGADIINMSFSLEHSSPELIHAINYARNHGVVTVAAAGNHGERTKVYPAGFGSTVGVAATNQTDGLSAFTNYGSGLVDLAAPGVALVSAFPNGHYAAAWGTSFSTPLVAGTLALIEALFPESDNASVQRTTKALTKSCVRLEGLNGEIGSGRLDMAGALVEAAGTN